MLEAVYEGNDLHLCQHKYIKDLLVNGGLFDVKSCDTPMSYGKVLSMQDGEMMVDPSQYRNIVGVLHHCILTKSNISFVVNKLCQFLAILTGFHWVAVKGVLR